MALMWLPLDDRTIDAMKVLARSPWGRRDLDATWRLTGWPEPGGVPPSAVVFERFDYRLEVVDRSVALTMLFDPDLITGFMTSFAVFSAAADPDDLEAAGLLRPPGVYSGWLTDAHAGRPRFDAVWAEGRDGLERRLGVPELTGSHGGSWRHAVWRLGSRLLIVAQGEDFESYGVCDAAYLAVVEHLPGTKIPAGDKFYDFLLGQHVDGSC